MDSVCFGDTNIITRLFKDMCSLIRVFSSYIKNISGCMDVQVYLTLACHICPKCHFLTTGPFWTIIWTRSRERHPWDCQTADSDQPVFPCNLFRIFAVCLKKLCPDTLLHIWLCSCACRPDSSLVAHTCIRRIAYSCISSVSWINATYHLYSSVHFEQMFCLNVQFGQQTLLL